MNSKGVLFERGSGCCVGLCFCLTWCHLFFLSLSLCRLEAQIKKSQTTHREELAEANAQVQLAKSKTVSIIEAKRELGSRYTKCMNQRKEINLKLEKLIHDEEQNKRNHLSEKNNLERKIRTIKDKVERSYNTKMSNLSTKLEKSCTEFETEREHHQSTNKALEDAKEEIDALVIRLATAHEENKTPIDRMRQQQQQPHHHQPHHQQHHHQYQHHQHQHQQQQQQQYNSYPQQHQYPPEPQPMANPLSSTYGGSAISHQSREMFQQAYTPTIEETEEQEAREQDLIERMMQQEPQHHHRHQPLNKKPSNKKASSKKASSKKSNKKPLRPQSAGRTRSRPPQWTAADEAAQQQKENAGKPPLPPMQRHRGRQNDNDDDEEQEPLSPTIPAPPLSARSELDDEGTFFFDCVVCMAGGCGGGGDCCCCLFDFV